ncbi:MAG: DUF2461 domain-containing protein [Cyanobacteria bacterium P01_D01_bin.115]
MINLNFTPKAFDLLEGILNNNDKTWYNEHRDDFEAYVRQPFAEVLKEASARLAGTDVPLIGGPKTMFCQHRDIRFSTNKSPYSTYVSGLLTPSGNKEEKTGLVYIHLNRSGGFVACGFYQLNPADLAPIRDRIVAKPKEFTAVIKNLAQADLTLSDADRLTAMPRGYKEYKTHEHAMYLKLKSFMVQVDIGKGAWLEGDVVDCIVEYAQNSATLLAFGQAALEDNPLG